MTLEEKILIMGALAAAGLFVFKGNGWSQRLTTGGQHWDAYFEKYSQYPDIARAIAKVESNNNPNAMGDDGRAFGLMQIWYPTAKGHGYTGAPYGLLDPEINIYYATRELDHLINTYGIEPGIMGYNIGETRLRKGGSNTAYLAKVKRYLKGV